MSLKVVSFCTYLTSISVSWRGIDHDAHDFIDAIKDRDLGKHASVRVRTGDWRQFDDNNRQAVVGWWAEMVAGYVAANPLDGAYVLVPVPGSKHDITFSGTPRTAVLSNAIGAVLGVEVKDVLRWDEPMPSANVEGGTRSAAKLYEKACVLDDANGLRVVLVDDVLTSGGHLRASAAALATSGAEVILALCAGRADSNRPADPFAIRSEELDDFIPQLPLI